MATLVVHEPHGVKDLHRLVGIERRHDLRYRVQVPEEEVAQAAVVVHGARAGTARDEQLEAGDAERVLDVDRDQADSQRVLRGWAQGVLVGPRLGLSRTLFVGDSPDLSDSVRVEVGRKREQGT